ncbi:hypothetical protein EMCRGX_G008949 [Ephydatia muelleri]|eukprot:Em0003g293a
MGADREATSIGKEFDLLWSSNGIWDFYAKVIERSDPRVAQWLWMSSPLPTLSLIVVYFIVVLVGPRLMKNREPFQLKPVLFVFNTAIVALYAYLCREYIVGMLDAGYNWICQPVDYSYEPAQMRIASALWWYYFSKFIEFFDTFFFILRKKDEQVTFLHVYHHASMFLLWWIGMKWVAGGQSVSAALLNSIIHVIMYTYYALACLGERMHKYLWWKKHITHLQLLQFSMAIIHAAHSLYIDCDFPKWMHYTCIGYAISFVVLFTNFYIHAYIKKSRGGASKKHASNGTTVKATRLVLASAVAKPKED